MNYDTMEAGPEMDQLVGLKCTDFESVWIRNGKCRCIRKLINNAHDDEEEWSPSTNLLHAWEVAEFLASRPWSCCDLSIDADSMMVDAAGRHTAYRCLTPSMDASMVEMLTTKPVVAWGRTMPEAICRCALAALKSTHKES